MKHFRIIKLLLFATFGIILNTPICQGQNKVSILYSDKDDGRTYTSLEEALLHPTEVYRLKITKLSERDSLPEALFQLTELRELTVKGCRLCVLNTQISELTQLQYLNLDRNKLVRLPESIGKLTQLKTLVISRNLIETLPNAVAHMKELVAIDAWDNPLYVLPESISKIQNSLKTLDLRQIPLSKNEYLEMTKLLPNTNILFTDICECENRREHN